MFSIDSKASFPPNNNVQSIDASGQTLGSPAPMFDVNQATSKNAGVTAGMAHEALLNGQQLSDSQPQQSKVSLVQQGQAKQLQQQQQQLSQLQISPQHQLQSPIQLHQQQQQQLLRLQQLQLQQLQQSEQQQPEQRQNPLEQQQQSEQPSEQPSGQQSEQQLEQHSEQQQPDQQQPDQQLDQQESDQQKSEQLPGQLQQQEPLQHSEQLQQLQLEQQQSEQQQTQLEQQRQQQKEEEQQQMQLEQKQQQQEQPQHPPPPPLSPPPLSQQQQQQPEQLRHSGQEQHQPDQPQSQPLFHPQGSSYTQLNALQVSPLMLQSSQDAVMSDGRTRALLRLAEFSRAFGFSSESNTIDYWKSLTAKFYANTGRLKYTISNPDTGEKRVFELATQTIPHFYLTNVKSGVNEVQLIWEQDLGQTNSLPLTVECPGISLVSTYRDGAKVVSKGKIKATFTNDFQFDLLELTMHDFDEFIVRPIDEISTTPNVEPKTEGKRRPSSKQAALLKKQPQNMQERIVNEFGVAHDTMQMLEVTNHCSKMKELLQYSATHKLGAAESLAAIAQEIREHSGGARQVNQSNHRAPVSTSPLPLYSVGHVATSSDGASVRISASPRQIKRTTSIAISPKESGHNGSPAVSPTTDGLQGNSTTSRMSTPTLQATVISNAVPGTGMPQSTATGLGLSLAGLPIQTSPSMTSPVFSSSNVINSAVSPGAKSTKRGRTAPMTPTLAAAATGGTKGSVSSGANILGQGGKVRKGSGRKGSLKRKASLTDETGIESITPGTIAAGPLESTPGSVGRNGISMSGSITTTGGLTSNTGMVHLMSGSHQTLPFNGQAGNGIHVHVNGVPMPVTTSSNHQDSTMYLNALSQPQGSMLPSQKTIYPGGLNLGVAPTPMYLNIGSGGHVPMAMGMIVGMGNGPGPIQGQVQDNTHWQSHVQGYGQAHNGVHPQPRAAGHPGMTGLSIVDGTTGSGQMGQC